MPKKPSANSGYARLAQADEEEAQLLADSDQDDPHRGYPPVSATQGTTFSPIHPGRRSDRMLASARPSPPRRKRQRSNSGIDLKALNARLERWADEIASKFKLKRGSGQHTDFEPLEILHSVFQPPDGIRPATVDNLHTEFADPPGTRMDKSDFDSAVESVQVAIEMGVHPTLISKGSSGSYFAKKSSGEVLGVFKPKDEEPYASRNPKWTKWIHRNLFPCFFGRVCLIPNLSYVSEAAAYVLDAQLRCNLVPYTDVVSFSSKSFHYDFWDRRAFYRKKRPLPEKPGSFQIFLREYKDATNFFKEHPWPDQDASGLDPPPQGSKRGWTDDCRRSRSAPDDNEDDLGTPTAEEADRRRGFWTPSLQHKFREQLEKLVVLDYIMRNTDRGLDNWMIRVDKPKSGAATSALSTQALSNGSAKSADEPYMRPPEQMVASSRTGTPLNKPDDDQIIRIGAIDNSLSWPWKHPDAWRSYPYGWGFLPSSLIGQPFSQKTRDHFLPLLTSKAWWAETQSALRQCFMRDADFKERMFLKQMAVMKGQAWNVVETLKSPDHGPLELIRRARVCVWDDLVDVPVAVPLRRQSTDLRRNAPRVPVQEEMDISAAATSTAEEVPDLVALGSPERERRNPFNVSRQSNLDLADESRLNGRTLSPPNVQVMRENGSPRPPHASRISLDESRRPQRHHDRRFSHSSRLYRSITDEDEADLGYSAALGRESNRKKVIVERLENVKSKNPVFTWC